jgi:hypothetical protein
MTLKTSKFTGLARFHTTRWSVVVRSQSPATAGADESLESLCRQYWPPLHAYVRGRRHPPDDPGATIPNNAINRNRKITP